MLTPTEIARSLTGSWYLFRGRPEGLSALDTTLEGFWRSFAVIFLVLPLNAVTMLAIARADPSEDFGSLFGGGLPVLALDWILFPIGLALFAKPLGIGATYTSYVVARNWCAPLAVTILTVPFVLQGAGWAGATAAMFFSLIALGLVLRFHFMILRMVLQTSVGTSVGLVIVDVLLTLVIVALFD